MNRNLAASFASLLLIGSLLTTPARAQIGWTIDPGNPEIPGGAGYALAPSVLYDEAAGFYRMWFTAHEPGGSWVIDAAISMDGTHWFPYAKNPVLTPGPQPFESDGVVYAGLIHDGRQFRMYYTGIRGCCQTAVGLATSPDGITWTKYAGNSVLTPSASGCDAGYIGASSGVAYDHGNYYLMYQGFAPGSRPSVNFANSVTGSLIQAGATQQIGLATSTDGVTFTKSAANPIIPAGGAGTWDEAGTFPGGLLVQGGTLYAFYGGAPLDLSRESLGLATSTDGGTTWSKDARNPIFSGTGTWDWHIGSGTALVRAGSLWLWYAANSQGGNAWSIGSATAPFQQVLRGR